MPTDTRQTMLRENRIIIALLGILVLIAVGFVLHQARSILLPFSLAVFIGYVLNPLITFFERRRIPAVISVLLAMVVTFLVLNFFAMLIYTSIKSFTAEFPKYEQRFNAIFEQIVRLLEIPPEILTGTGEGTQPTLLSTVQGFSLSKIIVAVMGSVLNFVSNTVLVLLFLLFILVGRNQLARKVHVAFSPDVAHRISDMLVNMNAQIQKYLIAKTMISLATALLVTAVLLLFGVEFAVIWGILTFLLNFVPTIGSIIATVLPVAVTVFQFGSLVPILWVGVSLVVIQVVMGNILDPRIIGQSVNLSPLVVLFSLIFWGWLWGIIGMFLAVPISVTIKIIFENIESLRFLSVLMSAR
jgi:predicted PurR-regulated permease PerM